MNLPILCEISSDLFLIWKIFLCILHDNGIFFNILDFGQADCYKTSTNPVHLGHVVLQFSSAIFIPRCSHKFNVFNVVYEFTSLER